MPQSLMYWIGVFGEKAQTLAKFVKVLLHVVCHKGDNL